MSKKDYERIAVALRAVKPLRYDPESLDGAQWGVDVDVIADALAADNAKFQRARFLAACGMEAGR